MHRNGNTLRRLRTLDALQLLKERESRADLVAASAACNQARNDLTRRELALTEKANEVDTLMAEGFDFDRWRIGLAVLGELAAEREAAASLTRASEDEEHLRRMEWHREEAVHRHLGRAGRRLARRLAEKADEALTGDAIDLAYVRASGRHA